MRFRLAPVVVLFAAGCGATAPLDDPAWHQGVVEHDERALAFELAGTIRAVAVREGDRVTTGQSVAELDDALARGAIAVREAELAAAEAHLALLRAGARPQELAAARAEAEAAATADEVAAADLARARAVAAADALGASQLDRAREVHARARAARTAAEARASVLAEGARPEELARAVAERERAGAALALERERLARHALRSPIDGRVATLALEGGEAAAPGRPVLTVADARKPYIDAYVPQAALTGLAPGVRAEVRIDGVAEGWPAAVEEVGRALEFTPRHLFGPADRPNLVMRVRVRVEDPDERLPAGVPAAVRFAR